MGSVGGTTSISSHESANGFVNTGLTMSGTADVRNTVSSSGYALASGNANIYFGTTNNTFIIQGISTSGLTNVQLSFGIYKTSNAENGSTMTVAYSTNSGSSYTTLGSPSLPTGVGTANAWYYVTLSSSVPANSNIWLRWTSSSGSAQMRIDDVVLVSQVTKTVAITPSTAQTICSGSSVTLTATNVNGAAYSWSNGATTNAISVNTAGSYSVTLTDDYGCTPSRGPVSVSVDPATVGGTVNTSGSFCSSASGTLTLTGYTGAIQRWESSTNSGASWTNIVNTSASQSYSTSATIWYRALVQRGSCASAYSSTAIITIDANSVGGSTASAATVCSGSNSGTITLSGQTGNIQNWESSTNGGSSLSTIANTTTSQAYNNITATTLYRAVVKNGSCASVNSSSVTITVNPASVGGTVNSSGNFCGSASGTLTLTGNTGNVLRWESSTNSGGSWSNISNTTSSQNYNTTSTNWYRALVQNGTCPSVYSSTATITVDVATVGGSVGSSATVCSGSNSGSVAVTGQTGSVLNWESSTNGGSSWSTIANTTTSLSYNNITSTTLYRAVIKSGACASANSTSATITVNPATVAGTVNSSGSFCGSASGTLTLTGNTGSVSRWESSTNSGGSWSNIANLTTSQNYNTTSTIWYRALVQSGVCAAAYSSVAIITVNPNVTTSLSIAANATTICEGTSVWFTATPTNPGSNPTYQWKKNGTAVGSNYNYYEDSQLANGDVITCELSSSVTCPNPALAVSNSVTMTVNAYGTPSVAVSASSSNICSGTSVTFTATPTFGGASPSYQWKVNGTNVGTNSATYSSSSLSKVIS